MNPFLNIVDLTGAGGGRDLSGGRWEAVRGPHLIQVRQRFARNRTGCPGISYGQQRRHNRDYEFFYVNLGKTHRRFNITTLGREEAWRRALKLRAEHEARIAEINGAIRAAREKAANRAGNGFPHSQPSAACPAAPSYRRTSAKGRRVRPTNNETTTHTKNHE